MITTEELARKRRIYLCECGCGQIATDKHHCLMPNLKRFPQTDVEENCVIVNHAEHIARKFDCLEWRRKFWQIQCERYSERHMLDWLDSLPEKLNNRKDFL